MTLTREQIEELRLDYMLLTAEEVDALCDLALAALEQPSVAAETVSLPWKRPAIDTAGNFARHFEQAVADSERDAALAEAVRACKAERRKYIMTGGESEAARGAIDYCIAAIEALRSAGAAAP